MPFFQHLYQYFCRRQIQSMHTQIKTGYIFACTRLERLTEYIWVHPSIGAGMADKETIHRAILRLVLVQKIGAFQVNMLDTAADARSGQNRSDKWDSSRCL